MHRRRGTHPESRSACWQCVVDQPRFESFTSKSGNLEVWMVEEIEELRSNLQPRGFRTGQLETLRDVQIEVCVVWSVELIATLLTIVRLMVRSVKRNRTSP